MTIANVIVITLINDDNVNDSNVHRHNTNSEITRTTSNNGTNSSDTQNSNSNNNISNNRNNDSDVGAYTWDSRFKVGVSRMCFQCLLLPTMRSLCI